MRDRNFAVTVFTSYGLCSSDVVKTFTREEAEFFAEESSHEKYQHLPVAVRERVPAPSPTPQEQPDGSVVVDAEMEPDEWRILGMWFKGRRFAPMAS